MLLCVLFGRDGDERGKVCVSVSMCVYVRERGRVGGVCFENCNNWFRGFCIYKWDFAAVLF